MPFSGTSTWLTEYPWCLGGKPTGDGQKPVTLEPNVGPPGTRRLEGMQPEEELMSSLGQILARIEAMRKEQAEENRRFLESLQGPPVLRATPEPQEPSEEPAELPTPEVQEPSEVRTPERQESSSSQLDPTAEQLSADWLSQRDVAMPTGEVAQVRGLRSGPVALGTRHLTGRRAFEAEAHVKVILHFHVAAIFFSSDSTKALRSVTVEHL
ncbi:hypothetical protein EYF80_035568 [Liparis tanakae]|uniref:Uncharacterized protein n=1 Tax=Liparis tanakae TaxID=230148 RepID=A0A4Z2GL52_9TELE|nr:hypothetical protein EYF80_035568 [Liparis tanakae]